MAETNTEPQVTYGFGQNRRFSFALNGGGISNAQIRKRAVIAIGGNSITKAHQEGTIPEQFANTAETSEHIADMIEHGYDVIITHGNGPQVGNILRRAELAESILYPLPLDTCDADSQGSMGYMIQQVLGNVLNARGIAKPIATVVTQVVVDANDEAFTHPSKPIGPFYDSTKASKFREEKGWAMIEDAGRGYRRVVPSPAPLKIVELDVIRHMIECGVIVIAAGGGGIPVVQEPNGALRGVEAVIDKDLASCLLASSLGVDLFLIATDVEKVALNYNQPAQQDIGTMTVAEAIKYQAAGHFAPGSMGPKIEAALRFLERGGKKAIITSPECIRKALRNETGTHITVE